MQNILSNSVSILCAVIFITTVVTIAVEKAIPVIKNKLSNESIEKGIDTAKIVSDKAKDIIDVADSILPNNKVINVLQLVEKWTIKGVECAEQLYNASKLEKEKKNDKSKEQVYAVMKLLNIERTPELEKIIDGTIEAEVFAINSKL